MEGGRLGARKAHLVGVEVQLISWGLVGRG